MDVLTDPTVKKIAVRHNVSTAVVGLRWVLQHGMAVVTSGSNPAYQHDDLTVFDMELSHDDMAELDAI